MRGLLSGRRARIWLICGLLAVPLLAGAWLWLRQSSLVAVEHVEIIGVRGAQAPAIDRALEEAAKGMSTLEASPAVLPRAVAGYPMVAAVQARTSFPHSIRITVLEQPPVAVLTIAGVKTAVAADGVALGPAPVSSSLPEVADNVAPATGEHLENPLVLSALRVLGAAPRALEQLAARAYYGTRGLTVVMRNGLQVYFGDETLAHAKWLSLASVLAEKSSAGAVYVDVRLPDRPAAGFAEGSTNDEAASGEGKQGTESTVSALAAGLTADSPEPKQPSTGSPSTSSSEPSQEAQTGSSGSSGGEAATTSTEPGTENGG